MSSNGPKSWRWKLTEQRRPRPPAKFEDLIVDLSKGVPFGTARPKAEVMLFAAAIGYAFQRRQPLAGPGNGVRWSIFEDIEGDAFIRSLALATAGDITAIDPDSEEDDVVTVFEEYAAGGLEYLSENVVKGGVDQLDDLLEVMQQVRLASRKVPAGLDGFDPSTLELIGDIDD